MTVNCVQRIAHFFFCAQAVCPCRIGAVNNVSCNAIAHAVFMPRLQSKRRISILSDSKTCFFSHRDVSCGNLCVYWDYIPGLY